MAESGERIRVLLTEDSQLFASLNKEESNQRECTADEDAFAEELNKALDAAIDSNNAKSETSLHETESSSDTDSDSEETTSKKLDHSVPPNEGHFEYRPPLEDPYEKAWKYLAKHNILQLFQGITTDLAYKRPKEPIDYMIDEIEKLQEQDRRRKGVVKLTLPSKPPSAKQQQHHADTT